MQKTLEKYCIERQNVQLLEEWHPEKNGSLTPADVTHGSRRRVWWKCARGHEWEAIVKSRTNGTGCPYCANRMLRPGENDLATVYPELAAQWHPTRNGDLRPENVLYGSYKKVWWICEKGHEWVASIVARTSSSHGCPVCSGKMVIEGHNDLRTAYPELAAQWHPTKNQWLTPEQVTPYSNKKAWWVCEKGHEYQAIIASRTGAGSDCPYCTGKKVMVGFNDLATVDPELAKQWHPQMNGNLTPEMVTVGSHKKVWWICPDGHVWKAVVYSRAGKRQSGCPVCAGNINKKRLERYSEIIGEALLREREEAVES